MTSASDTPRHTASAPKVWLVHNPASGSNDDAALTQLEDAFSQNGFSLDRKIAFPDEDAPHRSDLEQGGVDILAVFAGDGTTHAVVSAASGWSGKVLVLPGGTMNMLSKRQHGDVDAPTILGRLGESPIRCTRPSIITTSHGEALTGVLAGPGTVWNEVREAMRSMDIVGFVSTTKEAISYSANGPKVLCADVDCGREEGYAAITITPQDAGLQANGYYAESLGDYAGQGIALLNRDFRDGPHDDLGLHERLRLVCPQGEKMGLLLDGEPFDGGVEEVFEMASCAVDLVMTNDA